MKIYLDDERPTPDGYSGVRTVEQVIELIDLCYNKIEEISFDHDLGTGYTQGIKAVEYIEKLWFSGQIDSLPVLKVHSMNPVAARRMRLIIQNMKMGYIDKSIIPSETSKWFDSKTDIIVPNEVNHARMVVEKFCGCFEFVSNSDRINFVSMLMSPVFKCNVADGLIIGLDVAAPIFAIRSGLDSYKIALCLRELFSGHYVYGSDNLNDSISKSERQDLLCAYGDLNEQSIAILDEVDFSVTRIPTICYSCTKNYDMGILGKKTVNINFHNGLNENFAEMFLKRNKSILLGSIKRIFDEGKDCGMFLASGGLDGYYLWKNSIAGALILSGYDKPNWYDKLLNPSKATGDNTHMG